MRIADEYVELDDLRIHYLHAGQDEAPLLLLHGGGADSALLSWGHVISPLAASHYVVAPDWPGYGQSDRPDTQYSMPCYISILGRLIDTLALEPANLVGISMGGAWDFRQDLRLYHPARSCCESMGIPEPAQRLMFGTEHSPSTPPYNSVKPARLAAPSGHFPCPPARRREGSLAGDGGRSISGPLGAATSVHARYAQGAGTACHRKP